MVEGRFVSSINDMNNKPIKPPVWLVTGASSGLGKAIAIEALAQGAIVFATFRKADQALSFSDNNPGKGTGLALDLTDSNSIHAAITTLTAQVGRLDVLVNNAGLGMVGAVEETSLAEAKALFDTNLWGAFQLTRAVLPMLRAQRSGHILNISSHGGFFGLPGFGLYNASKFALEGLSEAIAGELAPLGIKVTIVEPGPFRTEFAGPSMVVAATQIPDYDATAGAFRARMAAVHGKQDGDPAWAAKVLWQLSQSEQPPLRLPLGLVAMQTVPAKLKRLEAELPIWHKWNEAIQ